MQLAQVELGWVALEYFDTTLGRVVDGHDDVLIGLLSQLDGLFKKYALLIEH